MPKPPIATFTRDGVTREAYTPGEAVTLRGAGWQEVTRKHARTGAEPKTETPPPDPADDPPADATPKAKSKGAAK